MKNIILLIVSAFLIGCSSNQPKRFGEKKYFYQKGFDLNSSETYHKVTYWTTTDNDKHCFKDNPDNKEIVTVNADYIEFAIDHFYKRVAEVDVQIKRMHDGNYIRTIVKHDMNFKLELSSCYFENYGGLFTHNPIVYTSFRLKNQE